MTTYRVKLFIAGLLDQFWTIQAENGTKAIESCITAYKIAFAPNQEWVATRMEADHAKA